MLRVGVDVGGTFTDIFVYEEEGGEIRSATPGGVVSRVFGSG